MNGWAKYWLFMLCLGAVIMIGDCAVGAFGAALFVFFFWVICGLMFTVELRTSHD